MVEVWYGDEFLGVMAYTECCYMKEQYDDLRF